MLENIGYNVYTWVMVNNKTFIQQINDMFRSMGELPGWVRQRVAIQDQIRLIREALGMTQDQLAKRIRAKQSSVAQMEKGSDFQISTLEKIAKALNCELLIHLVPKQGIVQLLEEKSTEKATKLVSASSGNTALEMQLPEKKYIDLQVTEMKEEILKKHRKTLWEK